MEGSVKNSIALSSDTTLFLLEKVSVNDISLYKYNVEITYEEYKTNYILLSETSVEEFGKIPKNTLQTYILSEITKNENSEEIYIGKLSINSDGKLMVSYNENLDEKSNKSVDVNKSTTASSSGSSYNTNYSQTSTTQTQVNPGIVNCNFDKVNEFSMKLRDFSNKSTAEDIDNTLQNDINKIKEICNSKMNFNSTNNILSEVSAELGQFKGVGGGMPISEMITILKNQDAILASAILEQKESELADIEKLARNINGGLLSDNEYRKAYEDVINLLKTSDGGYSFADVYNSFAQIEQRDYKLDIGAVLAATEIWDESQMEEFLSQLDELGVEDIHGMTWDEYNSSEIQTSFLYGMYATDEGKKYLMDLMSDFYTTEEGQEYLRNRIGEFTGTYDDSLVNTEYVRYCMGQNRDDWLPEELQKTVGALRFIEKDEICNKYTWLKEEMLYFMDIELNEGEKWDTAFSEKATSIAIYNNDKLQYISAHKPIKGVSAEEQWEILEGIQEDKNGILEELRKNGELSYSERCNNRAALNELCEVVGITGYQEKSSEQLKTEIMNTLNLSEEDLSNEKKILSTIKEEKLNKLTDEQRLAVTTAALNLRNNTAFGNETVVLGLKFVEGVHKFGENIKDTFVTLWNSDIVLSFSHGKVDDELKEIAKYYENQYNDAWSKHVEELNLTKDNWLNSEEYQKYYYNAMTELSLKSYSFMGSDATFYVPSEDTIKITAWQNYLKDTFEYTGVTTTDKSSSSVYISTLKDAILGNDINYEKLKNNETAMLRVEEQFDAMEYVREDRTTNKFNDIYSGTLFEQIEDLSLIKRDNVLAQTSQQIGTMAIPIALGFVPAVGHGLSTFALGVSAFGGSAEESFVSGAGYNQAIAYGTVSAATEMAVEQLFAGIGGLGQGILDESLENGFAKVVKELADNSKIIKNITDYTSDKLAIHVAKELAGKGFGEGVEEVFTDLVTPITQYLLYQSDITDQSIYEYWDEQVSWEGLGHTFLVSALSGMVFGSLDVRMQTNAFNQNAALLDSMLSEYPQLQEYKTRVLAELIGTEITSDSYRTLNIIDSIVNKVSSDMVNNEAAVSELKDLKEKLSSKVEEIRSTTVEINTGKETIVVPQDVLLNAANTIRTSKYARSTFSKYITEIDGKVTIQEGKQTQFATELYKYINGCKNNLIELSYKVTDSDLKTKINEVIELCENASKNNFEGLSKLFELDLQELNKNYKDSEIDSKAVNEKINETINNAKETFNRKEILEVLNTHENVLNKTQKSSLLNAANDITDTLVGENAEARYEQIEQLELEMLKENQEQEIKEIDKLIENNSSETIEENKEILSELEQEKQNIIERHNIEKNDLMSKQEKQRSLFLIQRNALLASQAANITSQKSISKRNNIIRNKLKVGKCNNTRTTTNTSETITTTRVIVFKDIKSNVDSYMNSIKNKIELFIKNNKNVSNFKTEFDNFKQEIILEYESKINDFKQEIRNSYSNSIESINQKLETLSETSDEYKFLITQRENLISQRESAINELDSYVNGSLDTIISSINVDIISNNLKVSIFENIQKELDSFMSKVKSDCHEFIKNVSLKVENINEFKLKQKALFEEKISSLKQKLNVISKENLTQKHLEQFNQMIENARNRFDESMNNLTETTKVFISNTTANFETAIDTVVNVRNNVRNAFNNLSPNSTVNKFASKISELTKTFNELNIKEVLDSYVKSVETTSDIKVTEELIENLDSKLTDSQKQKLVNTLEEIGAFVKHYGIEGENLNKFYSSITMEEKPSKIIRHEINAERIAKLKDGKVVVKNLAIGSIVSFTSGAHNLLIYDQMYKYVEVRKQTGTATQSTVLGKLVESKLGKFVDSKIENIKNGVKPVNNTVVESATETTTETVSEVTAEKLVEKDTKVESTDLSSNDTMIQSKEIDLSKIHSSDQLVDVLFKTNTTEANEAQEKQSISEWLERRKNDGHATIYYNKDGWAHGGVSIVEATFDDGGSGTTISGDYNKNRPSNWYEYRSSSDFRITLKNSEAIDTNDAIAFVNTLVEEANKRELNLRAKNYWENDAFILYLNKPDLLETVKMLEDLKKSEIYGESVSRATKSFGTPMPFSATISDTPYYGISMGHSELRMGDKSLIKSKTYGVAVNTFNGYIDDILDITYDKLLDKYHGDSSKITVDEMYDVLYDEHRKYMLGENSNERIPFWMNRRNYTEYLESAKSMSKNTLETNTTETTTGELSEAELDQVVAGVPNINETSEINTLKETVEIPQTFEVDSISSLTKEPIKVNISTELIKEIITDGNKLYNELFASLHTPNMSSDAITSGIIKYIDFANSNNIEIDIDSNVKIYIEAYKTSMQDQKVIVNKKEILLNGSKPLIISSELNSKRLSSDSLNLFIDLMQSKKDIKTILQNYDLLKSISNYLYDESILLEFISNENFKELNDIISRIDIYKMNDYYIYNVEEFLNNKEPVYMTKRININAYKFIETQELIGYLTGNSELPINNKELSIAINKFVNYVKSNNIVLDSKLDEILKEFKNIDSKSIIINVKEVLDGNKSIVVPKHLKINGYQRIDTIGFIEILEDKYTLAGILKKKWYHPVTDRISNIYDAVDALTSISGEMANRFSNIKDFIGEVENNYVIFDEINKKYTILPNEIGGIKLENVIKQGQVIANFEQLINNSNIKPIILPETISDVSSTLAYKYLIDINLLNELLYGTTAEVNKYKMVSTLKNITMLQDYFGVNFDKNIINAINKFYNDNINDILLELVEDKLPNVYREFVKANNEFKNFDKAIDLLEQKGYTKLEIVEAMLSYSSVITDYNRSRSIYNKAYNYLISYEYLELEAANGVARIYEELLNKRGFDKIVIEDGITINIQKGINWNNQAYTIDYIREEIVKIKKLYAKDIHVEFNIYDTFNPDDKYWEVEYNMKDFKSAATGGNGIINIYYNSRISTTTLSHEYGHLLDQVLGSDLGLGERFAKTSEWEDAIKKDISAPSGYAKTNSTEDFAESIAHFYNNPKLFRFRYPNRYKVLSKYINTNSISYVYTNDNISTVMETLTNKYGKENAIEIIKNYLSIGNLNLITRQNNARNIIAQMDKNEIIEYMNNNCGTNIRYDETSVNKESNVMESPIPNEVSNPVLNPSIKSTETVQDIFSNTKELKIFKVNQELEVFDIPIDIEMFDESSLDEINSEEVVSKLSSLNIQTSSSLISKPVIKSYNPTSEQIKEVQKKYGSYSVNRFVEILKDSNKFKEFIRNNNITHINKIQGIINELYPNTEFSSKLSRLKTIINSLDGRVVLNIDEVVDNHAKPILIDNSVLTQFSDLNSEVNVETLYKFILGSNEIYNLLDGNLYNGIETTKLIQSMQQLLEIAKKEGYTDKVISEIESILKILNSDLSLEEKYNSISNIHLESNTPDGYYVFEELFKELKSTRKVVKALEEKGYKPEEISEIILHKAIRGKNNLISKAYYYRAYSYLAENGYNEESASTLIYYTYQNILDLRGTRVIATIPSGIQIKIVNNYHGNNKLLSLDNVVSMLNKASKYYPKTHLAEVIIYDSFSPRNIYCEKVQYADYVKEHGNGVRAIATATATETKIDLWEDFSRLEIIMHEYVHTIDRHITKDFAYSELFSNSSEWINAINKDKSVTLKSVTEYATASTQEDFAEFIQEFYKNPLGTAIKYPNRYKVASKYLNMEIDNNLINEYLQDVPYLFDGVVELSGILTEKGTILEFVRQYLFDSSNLNNIAKNVANELDIVYGLKFEILEDLGVEDALEQIMIDEGISQKEYIEIINNYLNGKDISSSFKDLRNLKILEMMSKEDIKYWLEDGSTNIINHNNLEYVSNEEITSSSKVYDAYDSLIDIFRKSSVDLSIFDESLLKGDITNLSTDEINTLTEYIKKGKIKLKDYNLNSESIGILIDKVPLQKIYPHSNVKAVKSFIDYFGIDTLVEFDKQNNNFLLGNNGEYLYNLFDYYDLSIPTSNESNKVTELENLIVNTINGNKKSDYREYTFNYSYLIDTEFANAHPELFLEKDAPQDLKDAFYNGRVNSGNEYNKEWSKHLEGKSVKGIIHEPVISIADTNIVEDINTIGENSLKYKEDLENLANKIGLSIEEVQTILSNKMNALIENSEFGIRRTGSSLLQILETGKLKNQFEVNHSAFGVYNPDMRMDMEKDLFGLPRNIKYEDRPIYGMLLPKHLDSKYVTKGPGSYYSSGDGVIYIFDKAKIMKNTTLTLGDSLDQAGKVCATSLSNPKYFGMFNELLSTIKTKEDLQNFDFTSLYEKSVMEVGTSGYYEFQLHGEDTHTLDNIKEIVFMKMPDHSVIEKLNEKNISWRLYSEESNS